MNDRRLPRGGESWAPSFPRERPAEDPTDKVYRACLGQRGLASSSLAELCPAASIDRRHRKAGIRNKRQPPPFLRAKHDSRCARPCFCRSGWQVGLASFRLKPRGGLRSTAAKGPAVSFPLAYSRSRTLPLLPSSKAAPSSVASRDELRARRPRERAGRMVADLRGCRLSRFGSLFAVAIRRQH